MFVFDKRIEFLSDNEIMQNIRVIVTFDEYNLCKEQSLDESIFGEVISTEIQLPYNICF
jgi:hypothetical protein